MHSSNVFILKTKILRMLFVLELFTFQMSFVLPNHDSNENMFTNNNIGQ